MASDDGISDPCLVGYGVGQVAVLCDIVKAKDVVRKADDGVIQEAQGDPRF